MSEAIDVLNYPETEVLVDSEHFYLLRYEGSCCYIPKDSNDWLDVFTQLEELQKAVKAIKKEIKEEKY